MDGREQILDNFSWLNTSRAALIRPMNVAQLVQVGSLVTPCFEVLYQLLWRCGNNATVNKYHKN
jgi:hypothetical protein